MLLSGIGDVVHGLPLALDVKERDPGIRVTWIAEPAPAEVVRHHPAVDRVVAYRSRSGVRGVLELRRALSDLRADLVLNAQRYLKSLWPTLLAGAPVRVGLPPSKTRDAIRFFHTHVLAETPWKHTQDLFLDFRGALGVPRDAPVRWEIRFTGEERRARDAWRASLDDGRPLVALVLASANPKKDWPAERWAELAAALDGDLGMRPVILGGPSEREARMAERVLRAAPGTVRGLGDSVRTMMARVDAADLLVAPDTGPLHVAHALGTPVVGLFAHTNPWRVGPWRRYHDLVVDRYTEPGEAPDPSAWLPKDDRMHLIGVDDVLERIERARRRGP